MSVKLVLQEDTHGCGIACLAMVTGQTYQQVKADIADFEARDKGLDRWIIDSYLAEKGYAVAWKLPYVPYKKVMRDWPPTLFAPVQIVMVHMSAGNHYIVVEQNGTALDPALGIRGYSCYPEVLEMCAVAKI